MLLSIANLSVSVEVMRTAHDATDTRSDCPWGSESRMLQGVGFRQQGAGSAKCTEHERCCQVDKTEGVITVATLCNWPCDRLYGGLSLLAMQNTTQRLGSAKMLSVTQLSGSPLPAGVPIPTTTGLAPHIFCMRLHGAISSVWSPKYNRSRFLLLHNLWELLLP